MNDQVNPEMVRLAREARGYTQTDLAKRSRLTQAMVSRIEAGVTDVSPSTLVSIARAVEMPEKFFYQTDSVYGAGTSEFFHRKRKAVPVGALLKIHAEINIRRMQIARLLRAVDVPECRIPQLDLEDFNGDPREVARAVRAALNVQPGPISSVVKIIEDAGALIVPCDFGNYEVDAISRWMPDMPPLFYTNINSQVDRFRMNLAHELAHMVMHRVPEPEMEDQANRFAAEFLMPSAEIKPQLFGLTLSKMAALKPYWRTSMASILKQASDLKCINEGTARYLWIQMGPYRKREPAELDLLPEPPRLLQEIVDYHKNDLGYSVHDFAAALNSSPTDLVSFYGLELSRPQSVTQFRRVK
jgi:Zn-dependent peptidase ImmA (M78 family)/transcriptional regulator with XRE-family HTH domain